jgi:hypothetical protein
MGRSALIETKINSILKEQLVIFSLLLCCLVWSYTATLCLCRGLVPLAPVSVWCLLPVASGSWGACLFWVVRLVDVASLCSGWLVFLHSVHSLCCVLCRPVSCVCLSASCLLSCLFLPFSSMSFCKAHWSDFVRSLRTSTHGHSWHYM